MIKLTDSLIVKYLSKEANLFEKEELNYLISKKKNHKLFKNFTYTNYLSLMSFNNHDLDKGKRNIYNRIRLIEKRNKLERYKKYAFAASVIFLIGISLFNQFNFNETKITKESIIIGSDKAVLTLENGDQVILDE